jgi:hypothetical protein
MSGLDLSNKDMYKMLNENMVESEMITSQMASQMPSQMPSQMASQMPSQMASQMPEEISPQMAPQMPEQMPKPEQPKPEQMPEPEQPKKMVRSFKGFVIFALAIILIAAFIYFTIYRLGWGVKECMDKNFHDCAALLTPEIAPLAATGLIALL